LKSSLQGFPDGPRIFTGNANPGLAKAVCDYLQTSPGQAEVFQFTNENIFVRK